MFFLSFFLKNYAKKLKNNKKFKIKINILQKLILFIGSIKHILMLFMSKLNYKVY